MEPEIEQLLNQKSLALDAKLAEIKNDIMNQYRLLLERKLTPPETLTVSFDIHFDAL